MIAKDVGMIQLPCHSFQLNKEALNRVEIGEILKVGVQAGGVMGKGDDLKKTSIIIVFSPVFLHFPSIVMHAKDAVKTQLPCHSFQCNKQAMEVVEIRKNIGGWMALRVGSE